MHTALFLTLVSYLIRAPGSSAKATEIAVSALPNLLGFSVGALAIILALSSAPVFKALAGNGRHESYFMVLTTALVHFIFVQVVALTVAILGKFTEVPAFEPLTLFLLIYAILVVVPAGLHLFQTARIYNAAAGVPPEEKGGGPLGYPRRANGTPRILRRAP